MHTIIAILLSPDRNGYMNWVSFEFLKGTWLLFLARAPITCDSVHKDRLILFVSLYLSPSTLLTFTL